MMIQRILFICLYVGYAKCTRHIIFIDPAASQNPYPNLSIFGSSIYNPQKNINSNDRIVFVVSRPTVTSQPPSLPQNLRPLPLAAQSVSRPSPAAAPLHTQAFDSPPASGVSGSTNNQNETTSAITHGVYNLGQQILFHALKNNGRLNVKSEVISPLSIAGVGYLLYLGSAGRTEIELATLLGLNRLGTNQNEIHQQFGQILDQIVNDREIPNEDKEYPEETMDRVHKISIANGLFLNHDFPLRRQYENVARDTYKSEVQQMDFTNQGNEAKRYIDNWVNNKTHGKIQTILPEPPSPSTQMIVVSALYFKALWWEDLGVTRVAPLPFYPNGDRSPPITVDTILFTSEFLPYYKSPEMNCRIIGLKYQKQLSTMYIIQPLVSNREAVQELQTQLTAEKLDFLISRLKDTYASLLTVPKFHLQNEVDLKSIFQQMGVTSLFNDANLTPITPSREEYLNQFGAAAPRNITDLQYLDEVRKANSYGSTVSISTMHHKVDLMVDEKGTEGGAATAAYVDKILGNSFRIDSPFLFVVRQDYTRLPLFYGVVFEPEQN